MMTSKTFIELIYDNSLDIYDALNKGTLKTNKLYNIIKKSDQDKLKKIEKSSNKELINIKSKDELLDEILFITDNKYKHLKSIRNIVNLDKFIEFVFYDKLYISKIKVIYTNLIIDKLLEDFYDYEDIKILSNLKKELLKIEDKINTRILARIDEYYILLITK